MADLVQQKSSQRTSFPKIKHKKSSDTNGTRIEKT